MKKFTILFLISILFSISNVLAQDSQTIKQLNFGLVGASYEFPFGQNFSIAPSAGTDFNFDYLSLGAKGNFYFDNLFKLPAAWDVYGGANIGFAVGINNEAESDLNMGLHAGARWFWNDQWGVYVELGSGSTLKGTGGIGVTMRL